MKLLTTIAAVLISISAYSQDLIEYNESTYSFNGEDVSLKYVGSLKTFNINAQDITQFSIGSFTYNGKEVSIEQVEDLTRRYNVGLGNLRKANRFILLSKNKRLRKDNNIVRLGEGLAAAVAAVPVSFIGLVWTAWSADALGIVVLAGGAGLAVVSVNSFSRILETQVKCLYKADEQYQKVADKINQAITGKAPSTQPSNTYIHESFK